ncbi:heme peroxidase [Cokeromyces recurvatus]|uniref:heme peroxidase n=1 Tax=Cokeromyces recurvatus TaxID=90255 RepID=UPI00221E769A|nr:heme peroxidase [Cokeromyces recurvatus]KAI7908310.1 heme peroxidase [Cokeromyces recurvatus]
MLGPSPVRKTPEQQKQPENKVNKLIQSIKHDMDDDELIKHFKVIVENIRRKNKSPRNDTKRLDPTFSSSPTGAKWTLDALAENIKAALHINSINTGAIKDVLSLPFKDQLTLLTAITERLLSKNAPVNDRNNTFESVMNILGNLGPEYSELIYVVTKPLVTTFYDDLKKPFTNYVGNQFRTADGSHNAIMFPDIGKARTYYTRTVTNTLKNNVNLPSPKEVFDKLLKRPDGQFMKHKGGINMMLLYLAIIITHDLFYTDSNNPMLNLTTSYLDLSSLYGYSRADQESIRQMNQGLLKPDQWFDKRLVIQPAGVAALMVVFSRNHNYIAKKLLEINENKRFSYGPGQLLKTKEEQDEVLFQTARLINNGCYLNIIIHDYIRTIIGTTPDSDFLFDPFITPSDPIYGNAVSIEFNTIYRWHAAIGEKDAEWLSQVMTILTGEMTKNKTQESQHPGLARYLINKGVQEDSIFNQLMNDFNKHFIHASQEELTRGIPIAGTHRKEDGSFPDADIIHALRTGYEQSASEIGNGRNTPAALEHIEIAGINQARVLNTCSFNDFRRFLNLTALETFEDFSENVEVQEALKELYGTPDQVELYAGLMVERNKPTGLRLPYTMGRAILSDAINLLRNDRILSKELIPANLTNWGYEYIQGDPESNNRIFPTLLTLLFPDTNPNNGGFTSEELRTLFNVPNEST